MRLSLRYRLLVIPALVLASTAVATAYAAWHAARTVDGKIDQRIQAIVRTLRGPPVFVLTGPVLAQLKNLSGVEFEVDGTATFQRTGFDEALYSCVAVDLPQSHPNHGAKVFLYYPEAVRRAEVNDAVWPVLLLGLGAGLMATVLSLATSAWLVRRIRLIETGTRVIAGGGFEARIAPTRNDELGDLAKSVNEMARQLSASVETQRQTERLRVLGQVSGGLAHQLRNAAAGARLAVQLAEQDREDAESLHVAERQLARMETILRQFLGLGRPEPMRFEKVSLGDLVQATVARILPQAEHLGVALRYELVHASSGRDADLQQFGHLLENLLLNAVEAAGPGGSVDVKLHRNSIEVTDSGAGLAPEVAAKLFEPFTTSKPGGIGLGLVVAKQVAEAHGATLGWERRDGKTVFTVTFVDPTR